MKKNTNSLVTIMALIGTICTGIFLFLLWKNHLKDSSLFKKFFEKEEDLDFDLDFPDEFEETEEEAMEEPVEEPMEEEVLEDEMLADEMVAPKARRGYFPLKFHVNETA
ncbi:MAG: hypothetical protein Q4E53_04135 [Eubacteriales bacterium]|nr:hypothetical protein [Eubacteriales bacterium]